MTGNRQCRLGRTDRSVPTARTLPLELMLVVEKVFRRVTGIRELPMTVDGRMNRPKDHEIDSTPTDPR